MLVIKLFVPEIRLIEKATTEAELKGIKQLILDKVEVSKTMKELGRAPTMKQAPSMGWAKAFAVAKEVLGPKGVTIPPFPDNSWYARINGMLKREGMGEDEVRALAEYARDKMRVPISFDFLICQQHRIRTGEFDVAKPKQIEAIELPKLPEPDDELLED